MLGPLNVILGRFLETDWSICVGKIAFGLGEFGSFETVYEELERWAHLVAFGSI